MNIPDVAYHGTSAFRWYDIQRDGLLRVAPVGVRCVSMSEAMDVAQYFADLAADCDGCDPVILEIDTAGLLKAGYQLERFSDGVWGAGECDWEKEIACWTDFPISFAQAIEARSVETAGLDPQDDSAVRKDAPKGGSDD